MAINFWIYYIPQIFLCKSTQGHKKEVCWNFYVIEWLEMKEYLGIYLQKDEHVNHWRVYAMLYKT